MDTTAFDPPLVRTEPSTTLKPRAHCILNGFGKLFSSSRPSLDDAAAGSTAVVTMPGGPAGGTRVGLLPLSFFDSPLLYGQQKRSGAAIERAAKPAQRDRLRLDRRGSLHPSLPAPPPPPA